MWDDQSSSGASYEFDEMYADQDGKHTKVGGEAVISVPDITRHRVIDGRGRRDINEVSADLGDGRPGELDDLRPEDPPDRRREDSRDRRREDKRDRRRRRDRREDLSDRREDRDRREDPRSRRGDRHDDPRGHERIAGTASAAGAKRTRKEEEEEVHQEEAADSKKRRAPRTPTLPPRGLKIKTPAIPRSEDESPSDTPFGSELENEELAPLKPEEVADAKAPPPPALLLPKKHEEIASPGKLTPIGFIQVKTSASQQAASKVNAGIGLKSLLVRLEAARSKLSAEDMKMVEGDPDAVCARMRDADTKLLEAKDSIDACRLDAWDDLKATLAAAELEVDASRTAAEPILEALDYLVDKARRASKAKQNADRHRQTRVQKKLIGGGWPKDVAKHLSTVLDCAPTLPSGVSVNPEEFAPTTITLWRLAKGGAEEIPWRKSEINHCTGGVLEYQKTFCDAWCF